MKLLLKNLLHFSEGQYLRFLFHTQGMDAVIHRIQRLRNPVPTLKRFGAQIGTDTKIYPGITLHAAENSFANLTIGSNVRIVRDCIFDLTDQLTIADNAIISFRCSLITHLNIYKSPLIEAGYNTEKGSIHIGPGAVIFSNSVILKGVIIGECAMVAAGSVVTGNVPPWTLVGGTPARFIKKLNPISVDSEAGSQN